MHEGSLLKSYLKRKKIQVKDLADQIDMSRQNMYIVFGKEVIPHQQKALILKKLRASEKEVFSASTEILQKDHSSNYRQIDENNSLSLPEKQHGAKANLIVVPLKAFGGFLMGYADKVYIDSLEKIYFPWIKGACFAFQVEGYSMFRTHEVDGAILKQGYEPGSYVICTQLESTDKPNKNQDYVFQTIDGIIIKKFSKIENGKIYLESINKDYADTILPVKSVKNIYYIEDTANNKPQ